MFSVSEQEHKPKSNIIVTFLIGNGFDLGLGLQTKYSDFIAAYLAQPAKSVVVAKLKESISKDSDFWGDAELAFGKLPFSTFGNDPQSVIFECVADFSNELANYLRSEAKRFNTPTEELKKVFSTAVFSYYQALGEYPCRNEMNRLAKFRKMKINIVNFNYTETIDKLLVKSGVLDLPNLGEVQIEIGQICHVHGALSTSISHLFGVNDISQVHDAGLTDEVKDYLVKSSLDRKNGCGLEPLAKEMISESDTVIIFGMSMGASDKVWWGYLLDYIRRDSNRRLCLVPYQSGCKREVTSLAESSAWEQPERIRFYSANGAKSSPFLGTNDLDQRIYVFRSGPFIDPDGNQVFCDPFTLS